MQDRSHTPHRLQTTLMADEERRRNLFAAIDRATRWVFVRIYPARTAANARPCHRA